MQPLLPGATWPHPWGDAHPRVPSGESSPGTHTEPLSLERGVPDPSPMALAGSSQEACLEEGPLAKLEGCWAVRRREDLPARGTEPVGEGARPWWVGRRCQEGLSSGLCGALAMGEDEAARALFWVRRVMNRLAAGR